MAPDDPIDDPLPPVSPTGLGDRAYRPSTRTVSFLLIMALLAWLFLHDLSRPRADPLIEGPFWPFEPWDLTQIDWMLAFSLTVVVFWGVLPLALNPSWAALYWRRLREKPAATASFVGLVVVFAVGIGGPLVVQPRLHIEASYQPPVFGTIDRGLLASCLGEVTGGQCHGTMRYPLGTTFEGRGVLAYTIAATRVPVVIALVTAIMIVPLATAVGTASAYAGGWVDETLMRVVDVVQTVPPMIAYIIIRFVLGGGGDMVLLVGVFGLLSWGNVARLVRSEALATREALFVTAAESAGASGPYVVFKHVVPNVSGTVVTATTLQIPTLVLTEVALSFLEYGAPGVRSWGTLIADGTRGTRWGQLLDVWWISVVPVIALALTVAFLNILGDALGDVLDPRSEG